MTFLGYRHIKTYKYEVVQNFEIDFVQELGIIIPCDRIEIRNHEKIIAVLQKHGKLTVYRGYSWGSSNISFGSKYMRVNLVKDVLFQLLKTKKIDKSKRYIVHNIIHSLYIKEGMSPLFAFFVWSYYSLFGAIRIPPFTKYDTSAIHVIPHL